MQIASLFLWGGGMVRVYATDYLIGVDQKIPEWLIKIIKLDFKSRFGVMGFSTSDATWGLWFSL